MRSILPKGPGPEKWCQLCHRIHRARAGCGFHTVTRLAKSGRQVKRLSLFPDKPKPKTKARTT